MIKYLLTLVAGVVVGMFVIAILVFYNPMVDSNKLSPLSVTDNEVVQYHRGEIEDASFDRGFFSEVNRGELDEIVEHPCLPPRHRNQYSEFLKTATVRLKRSRQRHSGIESAIGALQSGNGLASN